MGNSHALSGWCMGLATAPLVGLTRLPEVVLFAVSVAGFALLPDLDCKNARASRVLGPVTGVVSWLLRRASAWAFRKTRGPRDRGAGVHRYLSHTVLFALALGVLATVGAAEVGKWFTLGVVLFGVILAEDALGDWIAAVALSIGGLLAITTDPLVALQNIGGWIGVAIALGCVTHCLGDAATYSGCPFLAPLRIKGQSWFEIGPPRRMRFKTSGEKDSFEQRVVFRWFAVLGVLLVPGVIPTIISVLVGISRIQLAG